MFGTIQDLTRNPRAFFVVGIVNKKMKKLTSYLKEIEQPEFEEFLNPQKTLISTKDDLI